MQRHRLLERSSCLTDEHSELCINVSAQAHPRAHLWHPWQNQGGGAGGVMGSKLLSQASVLDGQADLLFGNAISSICALQANPLPLPASSGPSLHQYLHWLWISHIFPFHGSAPSTKTHAGLTSHKEDRSALPGSSISCLCKCSPL